MRVRFELIFFLLILNFFFGCARKVITEKAQLQYVKSELQKLIPINLAYDLSYLPTEEIQVIKLLVRASKHMDNIFLQQVYNDNMAILKELNESKIIKDKVYLNLFNIMFGPWNRLKENHPFINSIPKPDGANYYPVDMTKEEFDNWLKKNPEDRETFKSNFTMIRRKGKKLVAIPYSEFFKNQLVSASDLLRQASEITSNLTLKTYLINRAKAFLSNDYFQSDMDWMDLVGDIEVVIGPYEVYEDKLLGYKAAFESFICVVDHEESEKLKQIGKYLTEMEDNLPIADKYKNFNRSSSSPIKVVNEIFAAGDTKAGIQTAAFNLPNDERVREVKGSKKVILKNVMNAKFEKCWIPIVNTVLAEKDLKLVSFDAYFNQTLMHEISHSLGPGRITINDRSTTVDKELKELYSVIEECKADVLGIYNSKLLIDKNILPQEIEKNLYASYLGGMFRSIRFGIDEAHGGGVAIQINYYLDKGAFKVKKNGLFSVNDRKMKKAIRDLAYELLMIQAKGDYKGALDLINTYRVIRPEVKSALEKLKDVPIDIRPVYPIESEIE